MRNPTGHGSSRFQLLCIATNPERPLFDLSSSPSPLRTRTIPPVDRSSPTFLRLSLHGEPVAEGWEALPHRNTIANHLTLGLTWEEVVEEMAARRRCPEAVVVVCLAIIAWERRRRRRRRLRRWKSTPNYAGSAAWPGANLELRVGGIMICTTRTTRHPKADRN